METINLIGTTDGDGDATITADIPVTGVIERVRWIDGDLADGVGATLSEVEAGGTAVQTLLTLTAANSDAVYYPRVTEDDDSGAALTSTTRPFVSGLLKLVISSGGATKTGGAIVHIIPLKGW